MKLVKEYISSLKSIQVEELVDLGFYRPLAFLLVKIFYLFPITPNQISFLAIITGIISACFFSFGDAKNFIIGGVLYGISNVIDCCDGMIARLKKSGTKTGRIIDGAVDYVAGISVYTGFAIGLTKAMNIGTIDLPFQPWIMVSVAGASTIIHAAVSDYFRNLYESHVNGKMITPQSEIKEFSAELARLNQEKGHLMDKLLIKAYLRYSKIQSGKSAKPFIRFDPEEYSKYNNMLVMLWNFIGPATHITMLMISALLYKPMIFFYYVIIFANFWMLILFPLQIRANSLLKEYAMATTKMP